MNFISKNKLLIIIFVLLTNIIHLSANEKDSTFQFTTELFAGYTARFDSSFTKGGFSPGIRFLWKPNRKLNIGLESSFMQIEKHFFETVNQSKRESSKANLNAIPILMIFNMEIWKLDLYGGIGVSYVWTRLQTQDDIVISSQWNYTLQLAAGYTYMLNDWFGIGAETKYLLFTRLKKNVVSLNLKTNISLYEW